MSMRALSIRQPYVEQILRGEKTIEYRSRPTKIIGERFYLYAARKWAGYVPGSDEAWSDLVDVGELRAGDLPTGLIVGSALIRECVRNNGHFEWHLDEVRRLKRPRQPRRQPQPVWFRPF